VRRQDSPLVSAVSSDDSELAMWTAMVTLVMQWSLSPLHPVVRMLLLCYLFVSSPPAQEQVTRPPLFHR
jgi:hypothetical protein